MNRDRIAFPGLGRVAAFALSSALVVVVGCLGDTSAPPKSCAAGESVCGDACIETLVDPANCGACGNACKGAEVCDKGACAASCSPGSTACGASCVDAKVDPKNCGACGNACKVGQVCSAGACKDQCPAAQTLCVADGGAVTCVNPDTDGANCGGCGNVCPAGKVCSAGKCADTCGPGATFCAGDGGAPYCASTSSDNANCGACGVACAPGQVCSAGKCSGNCGAGEVLCPGAGDAGAPYCAAPQTDNANCGACGTVCKNGQKCVSGKCQLECGVGLTMCGSACVDTSGDRDHCGACNSPCAQGLSCASGKCTTCSNTNQASTATAAFSGGGSTTYGPTNCNDGILETQTCNTFGWISASNAPGGAWVQYTWSSPKTLTKMHMDTQSATKNNQCNSIGRTLGAATVQWWNGAQWVTDGKVTAQLDDWDYTFSAPVTTTQVRLFDVYTTNTQGQQSNPVVFEWQVFGCN